MDRELIQSCLSQNDPNNKKSNNKGAYVIICVRCFEVSLALHIFLVLALDCHDELLSCVNLANVVLVGGVELDLWCRWMLMFDK